MSWNDNRTKAEMIADPRVEPQVCGECWWTMVHRPPTKPFTKCVRCGRGLPWMGPDDDPERGYRDWDDDGSGDE